MPSTILADVEAGSKTGIYYITICNLPFGTKWQSLKDWVASACEVDHIEVFTSSTSAWVRLKGKDNFEDAFKLLNGGEFGGRQIIASDQNRDQPIKIKELVDSPPLRRTEITQQAMPMAMPPAAVQYGHPTPLNQHAPYGGSAMSPSSWGYSASYGSQTASPPGHPAYSNFPHPSAYYGGPHPASHEVQCGHPQFGSPAYSSQSGASGYQPHAAAPSAYHNTYTAPMAPPPEPEAAADYVQTEMRKVVLTGVERKARPNEASTWIKQKLGSTAKEITSIDLPWSEEARALRGNAFIVFRNTEAASKAVQKLDQKVFAKRTVTARVTVEGVHAPHAPEKHLKGGSSSKSSSAKKSSSDQKSGGEQKSSSSNAKGSSSQAKGPSSQAKGSSSQAKGSSNHAKNPSSHGKSSSSHQKSSSKSKEAKDKKDKGKTKETPKIKDQGPVIAYGSGFMPPGHPLPNRK